MERLKHFYNSYNKLEVDKNEGDTTYIHGGIPSIFRAGNPFFRTIKTTANTLYHQTIRF